jgi:hypothetical protein
MQTITTTTTFRIDLMLDAMGIYRLIRCNSTPAIINTITIFSKGIFPLLESERCNRLPNAQAPAGLTLQGFGTLYAGPL